MQRVAKSHSVWIILFTILAVPALLGAIYSGGARKEMRQKAHNELFPLITQAQVTDEGYENIRLEESLCGRWLFVISSQDYKLYVVDANSLAVVSSLNLQGWAVSISLHPHSPVVAIASTDSRTAQDTTPLIILVGISDDGDIEDVETLELETSISGERMDGVVFTPQGDAIYASTRSGRVYRVELDDLESRFTGIRVTGGIWNSINIGHSGRYLYVNDGTMSELLVYDTSNEYEEVARFNAFLRPAFSDDGSIMALPYAASTRFIDTSTHSVITYLDRAADYAHPIGFMPEDEVYLTLSLGRQIDVHGVESGALLNRTIIDHIDRAYLSRDKTKIYALRRGEVLVFDASIRFADVAPSNYPDKLQRVGAFETNIHNAFEIVMDPSGESLWIFDRDDHEEDDAKGKIQQIDISDGSVIRELDSLDFPGLLSGVVKAFISPDGSFLLLPQAPNLKIVDLDDESVEVIEIDEEIEQIYDILFRQDGTVILAIQKWQGTEQGTRLREGFVMGYDLEERRVLFLMQQPGETRTSYLAMNVDETILLAGNGWGNSVAVFDLLDREVIETRPAYRARGISLSQDEQRAYLMSIALLVMNMDEYDVELFYVGAGQKEYHDLADEIRTLSISNAGDNNIVLVETAENRVFAIADVGHPALGAFLLPDKDLLLTFDRATSQILRFRLIDAPEAMPRFEADNVVLDVVPAIGPPPLSVQITISAENIGQRYGSIDLYLEDLTIYSLGIPIGSSAQTVVEHVFHEEGEYLISYGGESVTVVVDADHSGNGSDNGTENGPGNGTENGVGNGVDNGVGNGTDNGSQNGADNGSANGDDGDDDGEEGEEDEKSRCFIATAAYGTPMASEIDALRYIRDEKLLNTRSGSAAVDVYYRISPPIADWIAGNESAGSFVRFALSPLVRVGQKMMEEE